jgi:hypothetical protein
MEKTNGSKKQPGKNAEIVEECENMLKELGKILKGKISREKMFE